VHLCFRYVAFGDPVNLADNEFRTNSH